MQQDRTIENPQPEPAASRSRAPTKSVRVTSSMTIAKLGARGVVSAYLSVWVSAFFVADFFFFAANA